MSTPIVNHDAALEYLDSRVNFERVRQDRAIADQFKLDRMHALAEDLGRPQDDLRIVHIAGSKGKGSTCEMLASALDACGYTTGLFTSPHLIDVRERVRIGGRVVDKESFVGAVDRCRASAAAIESEHGAATYFEIITAVALLIFAEQAVDVAILETGLGGRLDCTNIVKSRVVGLTSIQLEHTAILGDTLEKIAIEKAGIIKSGSVAISMPQEDEVLDVFRKRAEAVGAPLRILGEHIPYSKRFEAGHDRGPHPKICVGEEGDGYEHLSVPLLGEHQADNCALALAILRVLRDRGLDLPERSVAVGLENTPRTGRMEQIHDQPRILVDGAHTPASLKATIRAAGAHLRYDSMVVVFGCASDKDWEGMLSELSRGADKVIFTKAAGNPRAVEPKLLASKFSEMDAPMTQIKDSLRDAINAAASAVGRQDLILVVGSFFLAGEAKRLFAQRAAEVEA